MLDNLIPTMDQHSAQIEALMESAGLAGRVTGGQIRGTTLEPTHIVYEWRPEEGHQVTFQHAVLLHRALGTALPGAQFDYLRDQVAAIRMPIPVEETCPPAAGNVLEFPNRARG